ncbi:hypothetical protein L6164_021685 [Bauhinia variegata]|uniref:Uncharacterized protein n=1 Tax=Bauhinia variegata TaxID=167791 RepID=A0ACB9N1B5_BAUVA|nr:hypothetical protein L6164_021685 [Bauhinia variegata]
MVQLMKSETNNCLKRVKLEVKDSGRDELGPIDKRSKLDSSQEWASSADSLPIPPTLYNPLDEPSPLGLRLRKSPSLLDLIQMRLSQEDNSNLAIGNKKDHEGAKVSGASTADNKLKASNFPASILRIGTWEYKSRYEGDLVAKCYFAKHKLVWEVLDGCLKNKIEIPWSDIMALKANYPEDGPGTLELVLFRRPLFFREINPQPRKHTLWQATSDFTGGQASIQRRHFMQCQQGLLGKHYEKLIQCDMRLNLLSQQPSMVIECPYFEPGAVIDDHLEASDGFDRRSEEQASFFSMQDVDSASAVQSSSSKDEQNLMGKAVENVSQEITSPSSGTVMDSRVIEEFKSRGAETLKFLSNLEGIKVPGLHPSMSMDDLVNHIENCISEKMTSGNPVFTADKQYSRSILEELTQYLFNDSQLAAASDEQFLMSRVNSLCCLLQKDPSTAQESKLKLDHCLDADGGEKVDKSDSTLVSASPSKSELVECKDQQYDASGCKQGTGIPRKDSVGDLLLNLPRIASLPQFLFHVSDGSDSQVR